MEMLQQTPPPAPQPVPPPRNRRSNCGSARSIVLLLALLAGGAGLAGEIAIRGQPPGGAREREDADRLARDYRLGTQDASPDASLQQILAQPNLIPTHVHPLLGKPAPGFELVDAAGKTWSLRELLADGPVVLVFYHTYCDLCARQLFADDKDLRLFREVGARVVAISADPPDATRRRFERYGPFGFPVLSDPGNKVAQAYQVFRQADRGTTTARLLHGTFIVDRQGTVRWVNVGDSPFRRNAALLCVIAKLEGRLPSAQAGP